MIKTYRNPTTFLALFLLVGISSMVLDAQSLIDFEEITVAQNVNPTSPYLFEDFSISAVNSNAAVFPAGHSYIADNSSSFLAFAEGNTLTLSGLAEFSLLSLDIAVTSIASSSLVDFTITGFRPNQPSLVLNPTNVSTTQTLNLNWTGLSSVTIDVTDDAGVDNISVIPEPASALFAGLAAMVIVGFTLRRRRFLGSDPR